MEKRNGEYNVSVWKSKGIYNSELRPLHDLTPIIKYFAGKIGSQFNNGVFSFRARESHNQNFKCLYNAHNWWHRLIIDNVDETNNCPRNPLENFVFEKKCLFGQTNIVKIAIKLSLCLVAM